MGILEDLARGKPEKSPSQSGGRERDPLVRDTTTDSVSGNPIARKRQLPIDNYHTDEGPAPLRKP